MVRKRLVATVAVAPLLMFAGSAWAETTISNTRTTGVSTSTVNNGAADDIKVTNQGKFELTSGGPAITQNSDHDVNNEGVITTKDVDNAVGVLIDTNPSAANPDGTVTGDLIQAGNITHSDDFTPTDTDKDGDDDGDFVEGTGKYGIRAIGAGGVNGSILNSGSITIEGNDSFGISIETDVSGTLRSFGGVTVTGDNAVGINIAGDIGGGTALQQNNAVFVSGSVNVRGEDAVGIDVSGDINGAFVLQGSVTARGYRYDLRPFTKEAREKLDADDILQATAGVRVTGNVTGGVVLGLPTTASDVDTDNDGKKDAVDDDDDADGTLDKDDTDDDNDGVIDTEDKDFDNDGVPDANEGVGSIQVYGSAPGLLIGDAGHVALGEGATAGAGDDTWGLRIRGNVTSDGLLDNVGSIGVQVGDGGTVDLNRGLSLEGSVSARSYDENAVGVWVRDGTTAGEISIDGAIVAITSSTSAPSPTPPATGPYGPVAPAAGQEDDLLVVALDIEDGAVIGDAGVSQVNLDTPLAAGAGVLNIGGFVSVGAIGENIDAIAVRDASGTIDQVNISGVVNAAINSNDDAEDTNDDDLLAGNEPVNGRAIALDLSKSATGVRVSIAGIADGDDGDDDIDDLDADGDGIDDADEASVRGNILFGGADDSLTVANGAVNGDMSFGDGQDRLTLSAGAKVRGAVLNLIAEETRGGPDRYTAANLDTGLDITLTGPAPIADKPDVDNATRLTITNTSVIRGGALNLGANTQLFVTVNPDEVAGRQNTLLDFDTAVLGDDVVIGMELTNLIERDAFVAAGAGGVRYTIIDADTLTLVGDLNPAALANSPFFYTVDAEANTTTGNVDLVIRLKDANALGMEANQAAALEAVYDVLFQDDELADSFLAATNAKDFYKLYDQLLPDQGEGLFSALDNAGQALFRLTATRPDMGQKYGPDSFWVQEINVGVLRETGVTIGSETKAFGFIGGYESMGDDGGALGATLAYMNAEEKDDVAQIGEQTNVSLVEAGVYWRRSAGGFMFAARGAAGYGWFEGERRFIDPRTGVIREATASWGGFTGSANAMVSYEARFGRFYVRPMVSVDYLYLSEGERDEDGDLGFELTVDERTSSRLSASAEVAIGATFGRDNWWRPELRIGYRQHLAGEIGDTVAQFNSGSPFTLVATEPGEGAAIIGFSLKAGTPMSYVAVEGDLEAAEGEDRYNLRLAGRMMF
ncbi:MAG TPA: autotransporter outer membrane beta-barrel domain-containing protein [Caulobacter sp.]|nr:autotransporter outer membrane beta-barrel domain-containing protein [Caulobacter sp.]